MRDSPDVFEPRGSVTCVHTVSAEINLAEAGSGNAGEAPFAPFDRLLTVGAGLRLIQDQRLPPYDLRKRLSADGCALDVASLGIAP